MLFMMTIEKNLFLLLCLFKWGRNNRARYFVIPERWKTTTKRIHNNNTGDDDDDVHKLI